MRAQARCLKVVLCCLDQGARFGRLVALIPVLSALLLIGSVEARAEQPREDVERSLSRYRLKLERNPADHKARLYLTVKLIKAKRYEEALTTIEPLCTLSTPPEELELKALYYKGFIQLKMKQYAQATESLKTVISSSAEVGLKCDALLFLAQGLELKGDPTAAIEVYQQFISLETRPRKASYVQKARTAIQRLSSKVVPIQRGGVGLETEERDPEEGRQAQGRQALAAQKSQTVQTPALGERAGVSSADQPTSEERAPSDERGEQKSRGTISEADALFAKGDYRAAAEIYRARAQGNLPSGNELVNLLHRASVSAFLAGQYRDAQIDAEEALLALKGEGSLKRTLKGIAVMSTLMAPPLTGGRADARLALREGRFEDALRLAQQLKVTDGDDAELSRYEGKAQMGLGRYKEAYLSLKRASKAGLDPHLSVELALAAERAGDVKAATRAYRRAIQAVDQKVRGRSTVAQQASAGLERLGARE